MNWRRNMCTYRISFNCKNNGIFIIYFLIKLLKKKKKLDDEVWVLIGNSLRRTKMSSPISSTKHSGNLAYKKNIKIIPQETFWTISEI